MAASVTSLGRYVLQPHPRALRRAVDEVSVEVGIEAGDVLVVSYRIVGDLEVLRIPGFGETLDCDRLWAHTCCELFVAQGEGEGYVEWNFSPSGQSARFDFSAYRRRMPSPTVVAPRSSVALEPGELRLEARALLPPDLGGSARIALTTVIEDAEGSLSYWALRHPCDRPDFHHSGGFALALTLGASPAMVGP